MNKKSKIIVVAVIIVKALVILLWSLSPPKSESISDVMDNPDKFLGKNIQIKGIVVNNTIDNSTSTITFNLTDEDDDSYNLRVIYEGILPNNFGDGKVTFVKGYLEKDDEDNIYFDAETIKIGCASKYD